METMLRPSTPRQNALLAALPEADYERLLAQLELLPLPLGWALYESNNEQRYVYFPTTSVLSVLAHVTDGSSEKIGVVGNDGVMGVTLLMEGGTEPSRAVVQSAGFGYRIRAGLVKDEFERGGDLRHRLLLYRQALSKQMEQTAVCNRNHPVNQQLCRWLLLCLDRLPSNELTLIQDLVANILGVRREGVIEAAGCLHAAGLINFSRGRITVLDRPKLEATACECYAVIRREYDRLLSGNPAMTRQFSYSA